MRMGCGACGKEWYVGEPRPCECNSIHSFRMNLSSDNELKMETPKYEFAQLTPKWAGGYMMGNTRIYINKKPIWFHRKMMLWCFGWEWVDGVNK